MILQIKQQCVIIGNVITAGLLVKIITHYTKNTFFQNLQRIKKIKNKKLFFSYSKLYIIIIRVMCNICICIYSKIGAYTFLKMCNNL